MYALLALCFFGFVAAQQPQPCITPQQWEANYFDINDQTRFMVRGRIAYDALFHREHVIEEVDVGPQGSFYEILALFDTQTEYIFDLRARNCTRRPLTRPWRDFGIAGNATSRGEGYIGTSALPGAGLLVSIWSLNRTRPGNETVRTTGTWTYQACLPVRFVSHSSLYGRSQLSFYDITAGISNPSVFIPRPECLRNDESAVREDVFAKRSKKIHQ